MEKNKEKICSICQARYEGYGNNAQPVNDGRCCDKCNSIVIAARLNQIFYQRKPKEVK